MKTTRSKIIKVLQEGMLKGKLKALEGFLLERIFIRSQAEVKVEYSKKKAELVKILQGDLERKRMLENPDSLNSFGDYLRIFLELNGISLSAAASNNGIDQQTLERIIDNRIPLTALQPIVLARLSRNTNLAMTPAIVLIEKSLKLYSFSPSSKGAMARYSPKDGLDQKDKSMRNGAAELLIRASESKPFESKQLVVSNRELKRFLEEFKQAFSSL
jgi:hypothetical protein